MPNPFTSFNDWWPDVVDSFFGSPSTAWDRFKNGKTNEINQQIAEQNLGYQRERNAIEDARYAEETAYNRAFAQEEQAYQRAFAEEQRDYQRALQQQIFEREDTALERQASSLSAMGINPLSQQLNGLGAGQAVTPASAPGSASAGAMSSRGGSPLHNDFQMQDSGMLSVLSTIGSLVQGLEGVQTNKAQRDSILLENDKKRIENMKQLFDLGFDVEDFDKLNLDNPYVGNAKGSYWKSKYIDIDSKEASNKKEWLDYNSASRDFNELKKRGLYNFDPDFIKNTKYFASEDFQDLFEKLITRGTAMADSLYNKLSEGKNTKNEDSKIKKFFSLLF